MSVFGAVFRRVVPYTFRSNIFLVSRKSLPSRSSVAYVLSRDYSHPQSHTDLRSMTDAEWEKRLTADQYAVCRERCTEPPFSGKFLNHNETGTYTCVGCGTELFSSKTKYDSGSGWPSFYEAYGMKDGGEAYSNVMQRPDNSHGMARTEVICKKCDSHLGHVFDDGPKPTGKRFCINSTSLNFVPEK